MASNVRIRSIGFPFKKGDFSFPKAANDSDAIRSAVIQVITTARGERIMRPDFGCNAFDYVFEADSDGLRITIEREVRQSLSRWEPRVRVESVTVTSDPVVEPGQLIINIVYTILATGEVGSVNVAGGA